MKILLLAIIIFWSTISQAQKRFKSDSTKAKVTQPISAQQAFFLIGTLDNFKLLLSAVITPDDVTNNQRKLLSQWLNSLKALPTDSTKQKK